MRKVHEDAAPPRSTKLPIAVSHPDKVFWPDEGYTKLKVVEFYQAIFPALAPYVRDRLLSLERCPDVRGECFFHKEKPKGSRSVLIPGVVL